MSAGRLRIAAVQLNSSEDVDDNLAECRRWIDLAAAAGSDVVVLPENFAFFGPETERCRLAERLEDGPIAGALSAAARASGVVVIGGGMPEQSDDRSRPYNTCAVFDRNGELLARYRKLHLFDVDLPDGTRLCESAGTSPGDENVVVEIGGFRIGLSICYDLRFPELYRKLVEGGAEVLLVPAAFTMHTGKDHWHVLLRARAIESQCWLIAAAQWGKHTHGRVSFGHSAIIDPWGTIVAECSDRVGFISAELDHEYLELVRHALPSLRHRRIAR
jgi:predicted amidohydrolase